MLSFFPRDVLDEILDLNESVSEGFPTYSSKAVNLSSGMASLLNILTNASSIRSVKMLGNAASPGIFVA